MQASRGFIEQHWLTLTPDSKRVFEVRQSALRALHCTTCSTNRPHTQLAPSSSSVLPSNFSRSDQLPTTHRSPSTCNQMAHARVMPQSNASTMQSSQQHSNNFFTYFAERAGGGQVVKGLDESNPPVEHQRDTLQATCFFLIPYILHFEPSMDALSSRSDVISSIKILSSSPVRGQHM